MSIIKRVNLQQVKNYDTLKPGRHGAEIIDMESGISGNGNEKITVYFKLDNGHTIRDWLVFHDNCMWKFKQFFEACGDYNEYVNEDVDFEQYISKKVLLELRESKNDRVEVSRILPPLERIEDEDKIEVYADSLTAEQLEYLGLSRLDKSLLEAIKLNAAQRNSIAFID